MPTITESTVISGVQIVEPSMFKDDRGYFIETYRRQWFPLGREMVQGNRGDRQKGCIVGLHYHLHQSDYWYVPYGTCRVVLHDLRTGSPTDGATQVVDLGARADGTHDHRGIFIPPGVAHGFASLTDMTITYLVDSYYNPTDERGLAWNDPGVNADWGIADPILSKRDQENPQRGQIDKQFQPHFGLRT
jgi:dTDP-4-dehydrorhamnose 3,5-epimerase